MGGSVISRNLKLGGIDKCFGGRGRGINMREDQICIKTLKTKTLHWVGGVVSQLGGLYSPKGGVNISLVDGEAITRAGWPHYSPNEDLNHTHVFDRCHILHSNFFYRGMWLELYSLVRFEYWMQLCVSPTTVINASRYAKRVYFLFGNFVTGGPILTLPALQIVLRI